MSTYFLKISSLLTILYFTLHNTIERNNYPINLANFNSTTAKQENTNVLSESKNKHKIRKKTLIDLKYHLVKKTMNKENIIQLILNQEGKIIGYKYCAVFYPNYFTKIQPQSVLKTNKPVNKIKTNLCLIKLKSLKYKG